MNRKELEAHVQGIMDKSLNENQFNALQAELKENASSREFFRHSMEVEMLLEESLQPWSINPISSQYARGIHHERQRRNMFRALTAAAALILISAVILTLIRVQQADLPSLAWKAAEGTQWKVSGNGNDADSEPSGITEGSTVTVISGSVRLEDGSGVVMLISGPAEVSFPSLNRPLLHHGWLWVDSSDSSEPFVVETDHLNFRDIGTRFGVRAKENDQAELHLIEGLVEVTSKLPSAKRIVVKPKQVGVLINEDGQQSELSLAADPFPKLDELLNQPASYRTTILSQAPAGYWKLDNLKSGGLHNEIQNGTSGKADDDVTQGSQGMGQDDGFNGFTPENRSAFMSGGKDSSVLYQLDSYGGVSHKEGGVSFWIKREQGNERREILWLAGSSKPGSRGITEKAEMYLQLAETGQVEFFIENGKIDLLLSSSTSIIDGQWHHVVASWAPVAVELFIDGQRVGRADDHSQLRQKTFTGRDVRFGKPSWDLHQSGAYSFTGWVDEIAIWERPLSHLEVAHQYRASKGADTDL
jgi:ferric-dicitrate binding protein FerR (iron transport regulator)